jgi:hypothetical protein
MGKKIGLWVDHAHANFVTIVDGDIHTSTMNSNVESRYRLSGGARSKVPYGPQDVASEGKAEDRRSHQLHHYYSDIITFIKDAEKIYICGPGEAKIELNKEIKKRKDFKGIILAVDTADKMTKNQLVAKIKKLLLD